jgi:3-hydroxyacyl-CoA dehydrogenase/3-hydroxy-2-methylbutyryl-CoA dehydrogenase
MDLAGKIAVITGGASGLGLATAKAYVAKGAKVSLFDLNETAGAAAVAELGEDKAAFFKVNVVDETMFKAAINGTLEKFGAVHIVNNFAGVGSAQKVYSDRKGTHDSDHWNFVTSINLTGTFNGLRFGAEAISKNAPMNEFGARGVIINTASIAAYEGQIGQVAYAASKAGVIGMTLPAARDLAPLGIRVNTIVPGLFLTPLLEQAPDEMKDALASMVVNPKRLGDPAEIAHLSVAIAENEYMNGESIRLDGAIRMQPK